jgi:hypothetical protein
MTINNLPNPTKVQRFKLWQALYLSWYSGDFYFDVYNNWRKHFSLLLLTICFVIGLPLSIKADKNINTYINKEIVFPVNKMPKLVIRHGILTNPKNKQMFIKNANHKVAVIIDTTNKISSLPAKQYPEAFLLLNTSDWSILLSPNEFVNYFTEANSALRQKYDKRELEIIETGTIFDHKFLQYAAWFFRIGVIPSLTLMLYSIFLTFLFFFSLTSKFLATVLFKLELSMKQSSRIMLISSIPTLWLIFIIAIFPISSKWLGLTALLLIPFYYNFAIYQIKKRLKIKTRGIIGRLMNQQ